MTSKDFDVWRKTDKTGFKGAIKKYTVNGTEVAVGFTLNNAYIIEDDQGYYGVADIDKCIKELGEDVEDTDAAVIICNEDGFAENERGRFSTEQTADIWERCKYMKSLDTAKDLTLPS